MLPRGIPCFLLMVPVRNPCSLGTNTTWRHPVPRSASLLSRSIKTLKTSGGFGKVVGLRKLLLLSASQIQGGPWLSFQILHPGGRTYGLFTSSP